MNPLQLRLAALRRRLRLVVTFRGVALVLVILLLAAVATGLVDWRLPGHLPSLVRAILLGFFAGPAEDEEAEIAGPIVIDESGRTYRGGAGGGGGGPRRPGAA